MEEVLIPQVFSRSIFVKDSDEGVIEIANVADATDFLSTWPESRRGPIYKTALRACHAARDGQLTVDGARNAFAGFARSVGIREPDAASIDPWKVKPKTGRMPL